MAFKSKKVSSGVQIIEQEIGKFSGIITRLQKGIVLCEQKQDTNNSTISRLEEENTMLAGKITKASTVRDNIQAIIGEDEE